MVVHNCLLREAFCMQLKEFLIGIKMVKYFKCSSVIYVKPQNDIVRI